MRRFILTILAILPLLAGCSDKGKVIPGEDFSEIFVDMFLADQWLRDHPSYRDKADTTLFFEPIFRKYGYSFKDYNASLDFYAGDTDLLTEITTAAALKLNEMKEHYEALVEHNREVRLENERLMVDYTEMDFTSDSLVWRGGKVLWPELIVQERTDTLYKTGVETAEEHQGEPVILEQSESIKVEFSEPAPRFEKEIKMIN